MNDTPTHTPTHSTPAPNPLLLSPQVNYHDLARRSSPPLTPSMVRKILTGKVGCGFEVAKRVAVVLGVSLDTLYDHYEAVRRCPVTRNRVTAKPD